MANFSFESAAFIKSAIVCDGRNSNLQNTSNRQPDKKYRLQRIQAALQQWRQETNNTSERMPTDIQLRVCPAAARLHLRSLIVSAGGYHKVHAQLNILPAKSYRDLTRERKLSELAAELFKVCKRKNRPSPYDDFPSRKTIRSLSPILANKIEAFPSRTGYVSLSNFIQKQRPPAENTSNEIVEGPISYRSKKQAWRKWTNVAVILDHIRPYQVHPRVMPPLKQLPPSVIQAIHRKGGSLAFAINAKLVLYKNFNNVQLWSSLVGWLAGEVNRTRTTAIPVEDPEMYKKLVIEQSQNPPSFPSTKTIHGAGYSSHVTRFGGRKVLALRLGFSPKDGMAGLVMSEFSVQFAADILEYAVMKVVPASDGSIAMPTVQSLQQDNMHHLAAAVDHFHGEAVVGRRVGLVFGLPLT